MKDRVITTELQFFGIQKKGRLLLKKKQFILKKEPIDSEKKSVSFKKKSADFFSKPTDFPEEGPVYFTETLSPPLQTLILFLG